ncbi:MucBP domain-containing protein [Companilactobacillus futsaii]|uniref:MucBP domain-containing protein n=1 Tax=Companilactobacillus futsaii TaxID=938155 RepID=A0A5B7SWK8_9LACO|nr:MucBP domain-containing protein [Companilactobacillus futsaii]QCX24078.1 hypothetical protein FG051_02710 [Companilactobacillus futsaii]
MLTNKKCVYLGATIISALVLTILSGQTVKADTTTNNQITNNQTTNNQTITLAPATKATPTAAKISVATDDDTTKGQTAVSSVNDSSISAAKNQGDSTATTSTNDNSSNDSSDSSLKDNSANQGSTAVATNSTSEPSTNDVNTSSTANQTTTNTNSDNSGTNTSSPATDNNSNENVVQDMNGVDISLSNASMQGIYVLHNDIYPNLAVPDKPVVGQTNITNDTNSYALPDNLTDTTVVNFADPYLAGLVKQGLGLKSTDNITVGDIKNFKGAILNINGSEIADGYGNGEESSKDVTPIESLDGMQYLQLLPNDIVSFTGTLASDAKANPSLTPLYGLKLSKLNLLGNYSDGTMKEINVSQIPKLTMAISHDMLNEVLTPTNDIDNQLSLSGDEPFNGLTNDELKTIAPWIEQNSKRETSQGIRGFLGDIYFLNSTIDDFSPLKNVFADNYTVAIFQSHGMKYDPTPVYGVKGQPLIFKADPIYDNYGFEFKNPNDFEAYNDPDSVVRPVKSLGNDTYEIDNPDMSVKMLIYGYPFLSADENKVQGFYNPLLTATMHSQPLIWQDHPNVTIEYVDQNGNPIMSNGVPLTKTVNGNLIGDSFDLTKEASLNGYTLLSPTTSLQGKYEQAPQVIKLSFKENPVPVSANDDEVNPTTVNTLATPITIIPKVVGTVSLHDLTGAETGKNLVVNGSEITISATAMINGQEYYQIGNKWVCADDFDIVETDKLGYVRIYNEVANLINSDGQLLTRELGPNTGWKFNRIVSIDDNDFYQVATNEFVSVDNGVPYIPINTKTDVRLIKSAELYDSQGPDLDKSLPTKTSWRTDSYAKIDNVKMYRVATDEWIPADTLNVVQVK